MYGKIILVGNLTRDIEIKYAQGGSAIANTAIATSRKYKTQTGEQKEEVMFIDITFFGRSAEVANQFLRKGSKILVDGRLKFDQWTAQDGSKRSKHSVVVETMKMLDSKPDGTTGYTGQPQAQGQPQGNYPQQQGQPQGNYPQGQGQPQGAPAQQAAPQGQQQPQQGQPQQQVAVGPNGEEIPF